MIKYTKPNNLNGTELRDELNANNIVISYEPFSVRLEGDGSLWLDIKDKDADKAAPIVAAHNGTVIAPDNSAAKAALLAKLGITEAEARLLMGGN